MGEHEDFWMKYFEDKDRNASPSVTGLTTSTSNIMKRTKSKLKKSLKGRGFVDKVIRHVGRRTTRTLKRKIRRKLKGKGKLLNKRIKKRAKKIKKRVKKIKKIKKIKKRVVKRRGPPNRSVVRDIFS